MYRLNFVNRLDPNGNGQANWPRYGEQGNMIQFRRDGTAFFTDDYRQEQIGYMIDNADAFHF